MASNDLAFSFSGDGYKKLSQAKAADMSDPGFQRFLKQINKFQTSIQTRETTDQSQRQFLSEAQVYNYFPNEM